jgi:hypothetical protein
MSTHQCKFCLRDYKIKFNRDRHSQTCEFLSKNRKEQDNDIDSFEKLPSQREMFSLIQELSIRINKLEKENAKLKNSVKIREKRDFNDILNETNRPHISLDDWINTLLDSVEQKLEVVYKNELHTGIISLFEDSIDEIPLRAYDVKHNMFYHYDKDSLSWQVFSKTDFNKMLVRISHRFLVEFNRCWCIVNKEKIEKNEDFQKIYMDYYLKILGGNKLSDELRFKKIRHIIYGMIKKNIRSICNDVEM